MEIKNKDFSNRCYFSKDNSFLWRDLDNSFKTKWCGIWNKDIKFFEYFAYCVNGTWLTPNLCEKTKVQTSQTIHNYVETEKNLVIEEIVFPNKNSIISVLSLKNTGKEAKKIKINLECAVNIREKGENWHLRTYHPSKNDLRKCVVVESYLNTDKYNAIYGCGMAKTILKNSKTAPKKTNTKINLLQNYKDHYPNSKQRCFLSSDYYVELNIEPGEKVHLPFIYSCAKEQNDMYHEYDESALKWNEKKKAWALGLEEKLKAKIATPDKYIDNAFVMAQHSLLSMIQKTDFGDGMYAGFPWFLSFWSRDTFWSLLGVNELGFLDESKKIMSTIASFYNEEKDKKLFSYGINGLPTKISMNKTSQYYSCDLNPLFLTAYLHYSYLGGQKTQLLDAAEKKIKHNLRLVDYAVDTNTAKNQQKVEHTWMDTIIRSGTPIEVQALWTAALGKETVFEKMKHKINVGFYNNEADYFFDSYNTETKTIGTKIRPNALVALMFNLVDKEKADKVLAVAKKELHSKYGIRTLSKYDKNYTPAAYHNGCCWGLTSMWGACAYFNYNYNDDGLALLEQASKQQMKGNPYGFDECNDSDSGKSLGASPQAWSAGLFVYAIDHSGLWAAQSLLQAASTQRSVRSGS